MPRLTQNQPKKRPKWRWIMAISSVPALLILAVLIMPF
jgi:hypothetical protein